MLTCSKSAARVVGEGPSVVQVCPCVCYNKCYNQEVLPDELHALRVSLRLSRAALARFLGVAEITILRWEQGTDTSPKGLILTVLRTLQAARDVAGPEVTAALVHEGMTDQARALRKLFEITGTNASLRRSV